MEENFWGFCPNIRSEVQSRKTPDANRYRESERVRYREIDR